MSAFRRLWSLGFRTLLPITPPGAPASPNSTLFKRPNDMGKTPGVHGPYGWHSFGWQNHHTLETDLDRWAAMGAGVGIRCGEQPDGTHLSLIDADTLNPQFAADIGARVLRAFGAQPARIGRAPKAGTVLRLSGPLGYRRVEFDDGVEPGKPARVEILTAGRQFVAEGVHPVTREPYRWPVPLVPFDELPIVDPARVVAFLDELAAALPAAKAVAEGTGAAVDQAKLRGDAAMVRRAVAAIPNTSALFPTRESYLAVGYAVKAAVADEFEARDIWAEWCGRWADGDNDPERDDAEWRRMKAPFRRGASWLYELAEQHGDGAFGRADLWFEVPAAKDEPLFGTGHNSAGSGELPEPLDLFSLRRPVPPTELPDACVPPVVERWAADTAQRMGAPLAFTALSALATLSAAVGARLRLQPKKYDTGWTTPAFLWVALVENPGGKKSPAIGAATRTLTKLSAEHGTIDQAKWRAWEKASRSRKADANPGPEPRIRRYSTDSFTIESLRRILHDNPGGVLVSSDELTVVFGALDAYKSNKGADRPMFLRLFDGGGVTIDRVNASHHVANFGAAIVGGIQPKVIAKMAPDLDADGLLQRFVLVNGDGRPLAGVDRAPDAAAQATYDRLVTELATAEFRFPSPITIGDDARPVWDEMERKIERLGAFPHLSDAWRGHLNKWPAIFARLLLVFHVAERWDDLGLGIEGSAVTRATAERAARMADFLIAQSIFFYEHYVGLGQGADDLLWFAGHLLVDPTIATFTERDLYQARRELRGSDRREARRDLLVQLELAGWCEKTEPTRSGSPQWRVNPLVHMRFAHEAGRERQEREDLKKRMADAFAERTRMVDRRR